MSEGTLDLPPRFYALQGDQPRFPNPSAPPCRAGVPPPQDQPPSPGSLSLPAPLQRLLTGGIQIGQH